jgi:hypothetical protein
MGAAELGRRVGLRGGLGELYERTPKLCRP